MCGIAGIYNFKTATPINSDSVKRMTQAMQHRGPDAEGFFDDQQVLLGHRRLSIIDLSEKSNQPFKDRSGRYVIVFNGEIYNYQEIKSKLPEYPFQTHGDTEVVLAAFIRWGWDCLDHLCGMFAFAIWDHQTKKLNLARDRMGVKPLYYFTDAHVFLFASEIRSILASGFVHASLNREALTEFLQFQSVTSPLTMIKGIHQLDAGHWMQVDQSGVTKNPYVRYSKKDLGIDRIGPAEIRSQLQQKLMKAVSRRLISDVPLGLFLSGGIDSSAIVALVSQMSNTRLNTFNVSFDEEQYDESDYAELIARRFQTSHQRIHLKPSALLDELPHALSAMDTPSGDGINTYVISKAVKNAGYTVALSGIGGDELFAGYPFFKTYYRLKRHAAWWRGSAPFRKMLLSAIPAGVSYKTQKLRSLLRLETISIGQVYPLFRTIMDSQKQQQILSIPSEMNPTALSSQLLSIQHAIAEWPLLSQVSVAEYLGYTQNTLLKDMDQMGMAHSLEIREPFFDHELIEYALHIPDAVKYPFYPKKLLVESLGMPLPAEIVHRKKKGFSFPWPLWLRSELRTFCDTNILQLSQRSFVHGHAVKDVWKRFLQNDRSVHWMEIWLLVVLQQWLERNGVQE